MSASTITRTSTTRPPYVNVLYGCVVVTLLWLGDGFDVAVLLFGFLWCWPIVFACLPPHPSRARSCLSPELEGGFGHVLRRVADDLLAGGHLSTQDEGVLRVSGRYTRYGPSLQLPFVLIR